MPSAVLKQTNPAKPTNRKIVALVSRSLSDTEKRYSQIEKEALAIVWACERLYLYIVGHKFTLETKNRALQLIINNPSSNPPARLRRYNLRLAPFNFNIIHRSGLGNMADYLSRYPLPPDNSQLEEKEDYVNTVLPRILPNALTREAVANATNIDDTLQQLIKSIRSVKFLDKESLKPFRSVFKDLCVSDDGIVLRGERLVVPQSLQSTCVDLAHKSHLGMLKTKRLLRSKVWFPGLDDLVEKKVKTCIACQANGPEEKKPPIQATELPPNPWHSVGVDFFGPYQNIYLMVIYDLYSRFPVVCELNSTKCTTVVEKLNTVFSTLGIPKILISDNGPPFSSQNFKNFSNSMGFNHRKITPYWPQANGATESFMKNLAKVIRCANVSGVPWRQELTKFLANFRATPHSSKGFATSELLLTSANTCKLPRLQSDKQLVMDTAVRQNDQKSKNQHNPKYPNNKTPKLSIGDQVLIKRPQPNKIVSKFDLNPYTVKSINGTS